MDLLSNIKGTSIDKEIPYAIQIKSRYLIGSIELELTSSRGRPSGGFVSCRFELYVLLRKECLSGHFKNSYFNIRSKVTLQRFQNICF